MNSLCVSDGFYFKVSGGSGWISLPVMLSIRTLVFWSSCFFVSLSHVEGWCLCWLPYRLGDDQQAPAKRWSGFGRGRSILFLAATLASPQPSFGVLKRTSRWCKSPRWQPWWRSSALRTADCASSYRKHSSLRSWCGWSVSQHALDERQGNTQDRLVSVSGLKLDPFIVGCLISALCVFAAIKCLFVWLLKSSQNFYMNTFESFVHQNQSKIRKSVV